MSSPRLLCNLNFRVAEQFSTFAVQSYEFRPIPGRQPRRRLVYEPDPFRDNRHVKNAKVLMPSRQPESVFKQGVQRTRYTRFKLLHDLTVVASLLTSNNVTEWSRLRQDGFPPTAKNHCLSVATDSQNLGGMMNRAFDCILDPEWQRRYQMGFHVVKLYNTANVYVIEPRFLASIAIWEFLYAINHVPARIDPADCYDDLRRVNLDSKLCYVAREYLISRRNLRKQHLEVFCHLRNQLSHYGRLPIIIPYAPEWLKALSIEALESYMDLFFWLTQIIVLKTLDVDSIPHLRAMSVPEYMEELFETGQVQACRFR